MKPKSKKKSRKPSRKGIFILPNLFTSASLFGGFYAIIAAIQGRYESAAIAIIISSIFDGLDGRIARFTGTTSNFGTEYDSLSDPLQRWLSYGLSNLLVVSDGSRLLCMWYAEPSGWQGSMSKKG